MKKYLIFFFVLKGVIVYSQISGSNKVWLMGYDCCSHPQFQGMKMDFSSGLPMVNTFPWHMNFHATNGQFFDANNNLLFCSNGIYVANALDDTMQNGGGLNPSAYTTARNSSGLLLIQGNLVIPFPEDSTKYFLFHLTIDDLHNTNATFYIYYSIIDMSLNGGLGAVIQKNTVLFSDTLTGGFTATKHANGRDSWVVVNKGFSGTVFKFLITPNGITIYSQDLFYGLKYPGQMAFSPNGEKFACYEPVYEDLNIWDFDRCTGMFSNYVHVDIDDSASVPGAVFSPNGRYLYLSSSGVNSAYIYQFDMQASDIALSKQIIATRDSTFVDFSQSALGPDNKIYIVGAQRSLHVIESPDSGGAACQFCRSCIQLPAYNAFTIPNHPNYALGPIVGSLCDTVRTDVSTITSPIEPFYLFPNPASNVVYITQHKKETINSVNIFNALGKQQSISYSSINNGEYVEVNTSELVSGLYFLEMQTGKQKIVRKFVKK